MVLNMLVDGVRIRFKVMENLSMRTRMSMRVSSMPTELTDLESTFKNVVKRTRATGLTTSHTAKEN